MVAGRMDGLEEGQVPAGTGQSPPEPPIVHYYLDFDSPLPTIPQHVARDDLPPCPDLGEYGSPLAWAPARKNLMMALACVSTFSSAYSASSYAPPAVLMAQDLDASRVAVLAGITTFCMGFALAPMALAPISEVLGRYPVMVASGVVFVIFEAVCSVVPNLAGMLIARLLVGVGGSTFSAVIGGVIADVWPKEERNTPLALFSGFVMGGTGAGPLVTSAFIDAINDGTLAWKWSFWHQVIFNVMLIVFIAFLFKESRASVLLRRKAKKLNAWYEELESMGVQGMAMHGFATQAEATPFSSALSLPQETAESSPGEKIAEQSRAVRRIRWLIKADEQRLSVPRMLLTSVRRPFFLLFTEPVVFFFSLWAAFSWGVLYLSIAVVPYLYDRNFALSSRSYIAMIVASVVATVVGIWQERVLRHPQWKKNSEVPYTKSKFWAFMREYFPAEAPEARLYFACITTLMLPAGLFGGFMSPQSMTDTAVPVGIGFGLWGIYSVYLASFNYTSDTYHIYASSALAANSFCRNVLGGAFPLVTGAMFDDLGLKGAGGMLGGIATVLTLTPWVLVFFGKRIRARSKFAIALQQ